MLLFFKKILKHNHYSYIYLNLKYKCYSPCRNIGKQLACYALANRDRKRLNTIFYFNAMLHNKKADGALQTSPPSSSPLLLPQNRQKWNEFEIPSSGSNKTYLDIKIKKNNNKK